LKIHIYPDKKIDSIDLHLAVSLFESPFQDNTGVLRDLKTLDLGKSLIFGRMNVGKILIISGFNVK